jgi:hypothetical protein
MGAPFPTCPNSYRCARHLRQNGFPRVCTGHSGRRPCLSGRSGTGDHAGSSLPQIQTIARNSGVRTRFQIYHTSSRRREVARSPHRRARSALSIRLLIPMSPVLADTSDARRAFRCGEVGGGTSEDACSVSASGGFAMNGGRASIAGSACPIIGLEVTSISEGGGTVGSAEAATTGAESGSMAAAGAEADVGARI